MKLKKIFSLGLAAAMTASLLAGCGSGNPASSTTAATAGGQAETTAAPAEPAAAGESGVLYINGGPT